MRMTAFTILLSTSVAGIGLSPAAVAADANDAGDIVITSQRQAKTARAQQAAALNIENIQSAESIAKYPDVNAAEAISRLPGVALSIDTGEGRFVNIRGLDGNLNGATFGGAVLLNTQPGGTYFNSAGRAVEFDTVPIGAVDQIVLTKTGLPSRDAEGLGGSIELTPRTAIGVKDFFAEIQVGAGYQTARKRGLLRDEIVVGAGFGGETADGGKPFSFVVTQFLLNDKRGFDDVEAAYINDTPATPDKAFDALELRRYNYRRQCYGYSGELDFTPNAANRFYVRASLAGYTENVDRLRLELDGLGGPVVVDPANRNGFSATDASIIKTLRDERETHRNLVVQLGGKNKFGDIKLDYFAAYSRATYDKAFDYNTTFAGPEALTIVYDNITNPNRPTFSLKAGASIIDAANYTLKSLSNSTEKDRDQEYSYAANLNIPVPLMDKGEVKFGGKLRYREKTSAKQNFTYNYSGAKNC